MLIPVSRKSESKNDSLRPGAAINSAKTAAVVTNVPFDCIGLDARILMRYDMRGFARYTVELFCSMVPRHGCASARMVWRRERQPKHPQLGTVPFRNYGGLPSRSRVKLG